MTAFVYLAKAKQENTALRLSATSVACQVHVKEHNIFERDGNNLYCEVPVSLQRLRLGGEVEVPTLDGRVNL
ncbi:hypothetical protein O9992_13070 [Vibrio lentus]|nr:hypothetical protein [Vibrio lentus]